MTSLFRPSGLQRSAPVHQPSGASRDLPGTPPFSSSVAGSYGRGLRGQHHHSLLFQETEGDILPKAQLHLRWVKEWGITLVPQFILGSQNVVVDSLSRHHQVLGSEWTLPGRCRLATDSAASYSGSLRHCHELSPTGLFLTARRSDVSRHRCLFSDMGRAAGVRLSTIRSDPLSSEQAPRLQEDSYHLNSPFWLQKELFPELQSLAVAPSVPLPLQRDLLRQPHFHRLD